MFLFIHLHSKELKLYIGRIYTLHCRQQHKTFASICKNGKTQLHNNLRIVPCIHSNTSLQCNTSSKDPWPQSWFFHIYLKDWCRDATCKVKISQLSSAWKHLLFKMISLFIHLVCKQQVVLALLGVVLSTRPCPQLLWWWGDEKKTWVTFRHLFMVIHVSPLSLPHWWASIVRVGCLVLWSGWLVPEPAPRAVMVSGWTEAPSSASSVATSVPSPVCGADPWHVSPLRHYLKWRKLLIVLFRMIDSVYS